MNLAWEKIVDQLNIPFLHDPPPDAAASKTCKIGAHKWKKWVIGGKNDSKLG
jgi:hypothetical protein